ncbi:hypothetical protein Ddye_010979 [Dipteronia dyeriana]|uniref:Uncharacterized protein n=1 Tax=Dipteronia dyeriana TaxID=168575 RepID=A0AAE0CNR9_9ROSI|nr:hypothetical protein Ddye_010979 [Dipteronia dyeriana]
MIDECFDENSNEKGEYGKYFQFQACLSQFHLSGVLTRQNELKVTNKHNKMMYMKPLTLYKESLKRRPFKCRLLGIDVVDKYVKIDVSCEEYLLTRQADCILREKNNMGLMVAESVQNLAENYKLLGLVFGYSFMRNRKANDVQTKILIDELHKSGKFEGLRYTFWDKGISSKRTEMSLEKVVLKILEDACHPYPQPLVQELERRLIDDVMAANTLQITVWSSSCPKFNLVKAIVCC